MIQPINKDQYNNLITLQNIDSMYPYILLFLSLSTCLRNNGKMKKISESKIRSIVFDTICIKHDHCVRLKSS